MGFFGAAETAVGNHFACVGVVDLYADALVEDVAEALEITALDFGIFAIFHDAAFKLIDVFETFFADVAGKLFAADAAGAVGEDLFALEIRSVVAEPVGEFAEAADRGTNGVLEMAEVGFVVVASVDNDDVFFLHFLVEFAGGKAFAGELVGVDVGFAGQAEGDDLFADFDG